LETVIELISHTTTQEGLVVTAIKDANTYPTGIKVSDEELASLHIVRDPFHGEWNYPFQPQEPPSAHGLRNEVSSSNEGDRGPSLTLYENEAERKA
jgi:hypothetical protein